jgi:hypothetical protein
MGQPSRHSFNYGQRSDGGAIIAPEGYKLLSEGEFIPQSFKCYNERSCGWEDGRVPATNRARVKGDVRAYAVPRK